MSLTPFIDTLKVDNFTLFKEVIADFKTLKAKLYNDSRRVYKPLCTYTAYEGLKDITADIVRVWNGRRIKDDKALDLFKAAIRKINLLVRELRYFDRDELARVLDVLEQKLVSLLPPNLPVQLELFAVERFDTGKKEKVTHPSFKRWKREALMRERSRIRQALVERATQFEQNMLNKIEVARSHFTQEIEALQQSLRFTAVQKP